MNLLRSTLLLLLTLAVVVSSTGLTVGMHLCAGKIQSFSLFGQAHTCPMEQNQDKLPPCHAPDGEATPLEKSASDCCEDQDLTLDKVDLVTSADKAFTSSVPEVSFLAVVAVVWSHLFQLHQPVFTPYSPYSPPALARNIPVLVQSFLI